jgi:hypothetical protein
MYLLDTPLERGQMPSLSLEHIRLLVWKFPIIIRTDVLIFDDHCDMTTSSTSADF